MYSNTQKRGRVRANGLMPRTPWSLMTTISPGSTSRMNSAPTMSRAQVSLASTQPPVPSLPMRPRISGRTPSGSRTPISASLVRATSDQAPTTFLRASISRSSTVEYKLMAMRWMKTSESVVDWNRHPRLTSSRRSMCALVRFPLCATAKPPNAKSA